MYCVRLRTRELGSNGYNNKTTVHDSSTGTQMTIVITVVVMLLERTVFLFTREQLCLPEIGQLENCELLTECLSVLNEKIKDL